MNSRYARAYTEVLEIISHFNEEEFSKIPEEKIEFYKKYQDKNYEFKINPEIDLSEQNISLEANAVLVSLFMDYFATEKQKITLKNILNQNQLKLEREKFEKYNPDNIFKKKEVEPIKQEDSEKNTQLIEYKETFFSKFINFIKKLVNKIN